jgi:cell division protein FtsX
MSEMSTEQRNNLKDSQFAFPDEDKEPINDAEHVRNAVARFDQVKGVSNRERDEAWKRIKAAAKKYDVDLEESDWRELFKRNGREIPKD